MAWVIRIPCTDLAAFPRYHFRVKTDKIVETVSARRAFRDHRSGIEREARRRQNGAALNPISL
jgi:hypothetical protein